MTDPRYSPVIMENLAAINQRVENADSYFKLVPNGLSDAKITAAYTELRLRQAYLQKAKRFLDYLQDGQTATDRMPGDCMSLYNYTVSPFMYDAPEEKSRYSEATKVLLTVYPDWEKRLTYRAKNIKKAISGTNTRELHFALKSYVEICTELFLWLRQKTNPLKDPKPQ